MKFVSVYIINTAFWLVQHGDTRGPRTSVWMGGHMFRCYSPDYQSYRITVFSVLTSQLRFTQCQFNPLSIYTIFIFLLAVLNLRTDASMVQRWST